MLGDQGRGLFPQQGCRILDYEGPEAAGRWRMQMLQSLPATPRAYSEVFNSPGPKPE